MVAITNRTNVAAPASTTTSPNALPQPAAAPTRAPLSTPMAPSSMVSYVAGKPAAMMELVPPKAKLVVDTIAPRDVVQSIVVNDCTVEASLASVARTPNGEAWLKSRMEAKYGPDGKIQMYTVVLKVAVPVGSQNFVDKRVTVLPSEFLSGHAQTPNGQNEVETWPLVWEAAISKQVGGQAVMNQGSNIPTSSSFIIGGGVKDVTPGDDKALGAHMLADFQAGKLQTLSTGPTVPGKNPSGLVASHAYTVTNVEQIDGKTWVTVRNPWGHDDPPKMTIEEAQRDFGAYSSGTIPSALK